MTENRFKVPRGKTECTTGRYDKFKTLWIVPAVTGLYMLSIMPRVRGKADPSPMKDHFFAHRGIHENDSDAPENSLAAFRKAVEHGFGIELDVQVTRDNVPVVFHDFTLERVCGVPGKVRDYTYRELRVFRICGSSERIPSLKEVLQVVDGKVPLLIEYKVQARDLSVCREADELLNHYRGEYCIESFNPLVLMWYRTHHPEVMRGQLSDGFSRDRENLKIWQKPAMLPFEFLNTNFLAKPDFVAYNYKYMGNISRRIVRKLYGNTAAAWTIKNEEQLKKAAPHFDVYIFDSFIPNKDALPLRCDGKATTKNVRKKRRRSAYRKQKR